MLPGVVHHFVTVAGVRHFVRFGKPAKATVLVVKPQAPFTETTAHTFLEKVNARHDLHELFTVLLDRGERSRFRVGPHG